MIVCSITRNPNRPDGQAIVRIPAERLTNVRYLHRLAVVVGSLTIGVLGFQGVAGAAGYPGPITGSITETIGATFAGTWCNFAPGTTVTFSVNGSPDGTATADAKGCVTFSVSVTDPHLAVNGGTPIAAVFGANSVSGTGAAAGGGSVTNTETVTIVQTASPSTAGASTSSSGLAFTGADVMALVIGALALMALGFLVLTFSRRRRTASVTE
jgi:hypothetical protein